MRETRTLMRAAGAAAVVALLAACGWALGPVTVGLSGLSLSTGTLSPAFDPEVTEYSMTVPNSVESVTVTVEVEDEELAVSIDGEPVVPGPGTKTVDLDVGANTVEILVSWREESQAYTVTVTREGPANMVVYGWLTFGDFNEGGDEVEIESGATIDFGFVSQSFEPEGVELSFWIVNEGTGPLRLQNGPDYVAISGDDADLFSAPTQPDDATIPAGEELVFVLKFESDGIDGTKNATATLLTNDPDTPTFTLALTGYASS